VVQLNRNNSNDPDNSVYLGQVTNSILDPNTVGSSFPASMLVVAKLTSIGSGPARAGPDLWQQRIDQACGG